MDKKTIATSAAEQVEPAIHWASEKFVHERIAALMAQAGVPESTPIWNAFCQFEEDLRSRVSAAPAAQERALASIDTPEFQSKIGNWAGAMHSCDKYTRTVGAKKAWGALIAYIDARLAPPIAAASAAPPGIPAIVREALEATFEQRPGYLTKVATAVRAIDNPPAAPEQDDARNQALEDAALAAEKVRDEYSERQGGKYPELRDDAETGAGACVDAIRDLMKTATNEGARDE